VGLSYPFFYGFWGGVAAQKVGFNHHVEGGGVFEGSPEGLLPSEILDHHPVLQFGGGW